jgi:tetratricopeptide (TPR) repeat protein
MSESIYERYKAALRRGHLAVLRDQLDLAIEAYREAAAIVPERALPHASIGAVELRRGRSAEALAAFEAALERSPSDEGALAGRADALAALGDRAGAAEALDRLAGLLEAEGRIAEACDTVARALELAESRLRRQGMARLVAQLRASPLDAAAEAALARAVGILGSSGYGETRRERDEGPTAEGGSLGSSAAGAASPEAAAEPSEMGLGEAATGHPEPAGTPTPETAAETAAPAPERAVPVATPEPAGAADGSRAGAAPMRAVDAAALTLAAEAALEADDRATAVERFLEVAAAHAAAGRPVAALDACTRIVAAYPDALEAQEALVHLYLELGWRALALEKVALLERLTAMGSDPLLRARVLLLARELGLEPSTVGGAG